MQNTSHMNAHSTAFKYRSTNIFYFHKYNMSW